MKEDNPANSISQSFTLTTPKNISFFYTLFFRLFPLLTFFLFILSCGNLPSNLGGTSVAVSDIGNVEGTVTDASAGALLSGVTVKIGDKSANTNNNGVYTITEVSVGSRTITAVKTGYQTYTDTVDIGKGTVATKNILLTPESGSDTTAPSNTTGSNFTNNGASSTNSISVTLSLSASDNVGVTGYYISESSTTPYASATGWTTVTSTTTYSADVSFTLSSGDGTKTIYVWFKDSAGNVSVVADDRVTLTISDSTAPSSPSISINSGDESTTSISVTLTLSAIDDEGVTGYCATETSTMPTSNDTCWTNVTSIASYSTSVSFTLSSGNLGDNTKTVYVWFRDSAGNVSAPASDSITLTVSDSTAPSSPSISINNGDTSTTSTSITLTISAADDVGISGYCVKESSTTPSNSDLCWTSVTSTISYSATVNFTLSGGNLGDNTKTVYIWFRDSAGNISARVNDTITLTVSDTTAPSSSSVSINNGDTSTTSTSATLSLSATDNVGVTGYYISETSTTPSSTTSGWTAVTSTTSYSATVNFTLSGGSVGNNAKTVYVWFRDTAGNISTSASDSITLTVSDTTAPSSPSISINNGDTSTTSTSATLVLSATDNVGVTGYCAKETSTTPLTNDTCWTSVTSATSYSASSSFTLSSSSGTKTVYVWFRDSAGNISSSSANSITLTVSGTTVTDIDGNVYNTVTIGTQVWMKENLKVTKYRNSDAIPTTTVANISNDSSSKYQWAYNNDENNVATYGRLYTWSAVTDSRGACPTGWHLPTDTEWTTLTDYLGGESVAGGKMKEAGTTHWGSPNTSADNSSGFTALPGGFRSSSGTFNYVGGSGLWWSATEYYATYFYYAWSRSLYYDNGNADRYYSYKYLGFSVRCVRD